jgi:hypothetical protein
MEKELYKGLSPETIEKIEEARKRKEAAQERFKAAEKKIKPGGNLLDEALKYDEGEGRKKDSKREKDINIETE